MQVEHVNSPLTVKLMITDKEISGNIMCVQMFYQSVFDFIKFLKSKRFDLS